MNKKFNFIYLCLCISTLSCYASHWVAKQSLPYEVTALVESFDMKFLTDEEKIELKKLLQTLDALMLNLSENNHFFLAKSSIYKWILQSPPFIRVPADFTLDMFIDKIKSQNLNPFAKWLQLAIKSDSINIQTKPIYQQYLKLKNRKDIPHNILPLKKKVDLLRPWAYLLYKNQGEQLNLQLIKYQFALINDITLQYKLFYLLKGVTLPEINKDKISLFSFQDSTQNHNSQSDKELTQINDIISNQRQRESSKSPKSLDIANNENWSPSDSDQYSIKPSPTYQAPKNLPQPVDDWKE